MVEAKIPAFAPFQDVPSWRYSGCSQAITPLWIWAGHRDNYARYQTTSREGFEISRIPTGYKSDIVIRFVDVEAKGSRALDARTIVDTLGPFYDKNDKKK